MTNNYTTSANGIKFIKSHEGEILKVYLDPVGLPTVGVGHLVKPGESYKVGQRITREESTRLLQSDLRRFERAVNAAVTVPITQNQFDALVSFSFNVGEAAFRRSSVLKNLNNRRFSKAADALLLWNKGGGRVLPGLVRRRREERELFLTPDKANSQRRPRVVSPSATNSAENPDKVGSNNQSVTHAAAAGEDAPPTEITQTVEHQTPQGKQTVEVKQEITGTAEVTEPKPQGFLKKLSAGVATLFGGTIIYDALGKFSGIQFSAQTVYILIVVLILAFLGFCVWAVLDTIKSNKRTELEAMANTATDKKDIKWVKPE